jgi:hypothetical protein
VPSSANASVPSLPGTPALVQCVFQAAGEPTIASNVATWTTVGAFNYVGNNNLTLVSLLPAGAVMAAYDTLALFSPPYNPVEQGSSYITKTGVLIVSDLSGGADATTPYPIADSYNFITWTTTHGGQPYMIGQATGLYCWWNGSGWTISEALGTNGSAYWTSPSGSNPATTLSGTWTGHGSFGPSGIVVTGSLVSAYVPERRWQVRVWPGSNPWPADTSTHWYTFLNVLFATDVSGGPTVSATTVQDGGGSTAAGPLIHRSSLNDTLLLFSQVASSGTFPGTTFNRVLTAGYTAAWTSTTASTDIILFDLSTSKNWSYVLDGGSSTPLSVSSAGVAQLSASGVAAHTLTLTAS